WLSQCPLRSESGRGAALPRIDRVMCALLATQTWQRPACDRRRAPLACERLRSGRIKPHQQIECALWGWKPVTVLVGIGTFVLEIKIERSVRVVLERHPTTDCEAIERVRNLKALTVIERD